MRASPQLPLFPLEPTGDAGLWVERFSRYFDDPKRHSGFLELAESAVGACPGDPSILTLAATAALLDHRPERASAASAPASTTRFRSRQSSCSRISWASSPAHSATRAEHAAAGQCTAAR